MLVLVVAAGVAIAVAVGAIANRTVFTDRLLRADFRDGSGPFTTGATSGYNYDIVEGTYRIQSRIADPGPPAESFANLARTAYAVDMSADVVSVTRGVAFGVGCFHSPSAGYAFLASTQDGVALVRRDTESGANNRVIVTNEQVAVPAANVQLRLSCVNHLAGSSVSLKGYLNGQQVISGTDAHGLDGFSLGALEFSSDVAGGEIRFGSAEAAVTNSSAATPAARLAVAILRSGRMESAACTGSAGVRRRPAIGGDVLPWGRTSPLQSLRLGAASQAGVPICQPTSAWASARR